MGKTLLWNKCPTCYTTFLEITKKMAMYSVTTLRLYIVYSTSS